MHNLLHIHEDILNFSAPDNTWCAVFERAVKEYVKKSHNGKGIETTFAHVEAVREYLKSVEMEKETSPGRHDVSLGIACSNDTAKVLSQMEPSPRRAFLVGSMSNIKPIEGDDRHKIAELLGISPMEVPVAAFSTKRCFKQDTGFDGTAFACGECVIALINGQETVIQLQEFLSVRSEIGFCSLFCKGICYPIQIRDNGEADRSFWSGFVKVKYQPLANSIVVLVEDICRKVILYPSDHNLLTVVDYMRHFKLLPYPLIVPVYPEVGDMILIQGESNEDIWHGHIQSIDFINKTVDVYFYIPSLRFPNGNVYVREIRGRGARNTVAWGSMISIAEGRWDSASTWIQAIQS
ncbi:uncharacterized protein LOC114950378 [Acropora millepora]|uniref:uncharacterized protein LOC114950378 n=1 Tax=Acropora millepora TaxID=45264 RepID=UPI001CF0F4EE|nr:uncharacterized protein LOC114950378 [Acropora millepora]